MYSCSNLRMESNVSINKWLPWKGVVPSIHQLIWWCAFELERVWGSLSAYLSAPDTAPKQIQDCKLTQESPEKFPFVWHTTTILPSYFWNHKRARACVRITISTKRGVCLLLFAIHCFNLVQILSCLMISIKLRGKKLGDIPLQSCGYMYFESYFLLMVYF